MKISSIAKAFEKAGYGEFSHTSGNDFNYKYKAKLTIATENPDNAIEVSYSYIQYDGSPTLDQVDIGGFHVVTTQELKQKDWREDGYPGSWPTTIKGCLQTIETIKIHIAESKQMKGVTN